MIHSLTFPLRWVALLLGLLSVLIYASPSLAHYANQSYVYFNVTDDDLSGRIEVTTKDLAKAFEPDAEVMAEADIQMRSQEIFAYFQDRLMLSYDGQPLPVAFKDITFLPTEAGNFAQLNFDVQGLDTTPATIEIDYEFLFPTIDPDHRGFGLLESNTRSGLSENEAYISLIFNAGDAPQTLELDGAYSGQVALTFLEHGVEHIWQGTDHVLFLLALLASSVMVLQAGRWVAAETLGTGLTHTFVAITVFTLANTLALGLASFGGLRLPVGLVEAVIAAAIILVALGNINPKYYIQTWKIALVVGLVHGLGFAEVLAPLGTDATRKAIGLASFNIGLEIGQLTILLVVFPLFFLLRNRPIYRRVILQAGSIACIAVALFWFTERSFGVFGPAQDSVAAVSG